MKMKNIKERRKKRFKTCIKAGVLLSLVLTMDVNAEEIKIANNQYTGLIEQNGQLVYVTDDVVDSSKTGLVRYKEEWYYLENGVHQPNKRGFVDYEDATFFVANGKVASKYSGLVFDETGNWYFLANGQLQKQYTGFTSYDNEWFYVKNGMLATDMNGILDYDGSKFLVAEGRILYSYSGLFQNTDNLWYYIANGQAQTDYLGLATYDGAWFYLENGVIATDFSGICNYDGERFLIAGGQMLAEYTGGYEIGDSYYKIECGQVKYAVPHIHSVDEIRAFFEANPFNRNTKVTYEIEPNLEMNVAGKLSMETIQDGVNAVNCMRYIAGMPVDIVENDAYSRYIQDGTFVLAKNGKGLSHTPANSSNIPEDLYQSGYEGTSSSNLGMGYSNVSDSVVRGYMVDDRSNMDRVGHRRWILSPSLKEIGVGYCKNYTGIYVFDDSRENYEIDYVAWPAENMPIEIFNGPWSLQLSNTTFKITDAVQVVMTNLGTGENWVLNHQTNNNVKTLPYFNVNKTNYGHMQCIIFDPNVKFAANDKIQIDVTGLTDKNGVPKTISYVVNFFSL